MVVNNHKDILEELKVFYKDLYKDEPLQNNDLITNFFLQNYRPMQIKPESKENCDKAVTMEEFKEALDSKD